MEWLGYSRVSRVGGREHLISPELQQKRIGDYAAVKGWVVRMLPPELDVSGARARRPILEQAIEEIEAGSAAGIIVSQIDRLSRMQMTSALGVIERVEAAGGQIVAVAENVDSSSPEGRMARNMFVSLAAMQRERNAVAIAEAKARAVAHGIWPTNTVPIGYVKGPDRRLLPGPDAAKVRRAFRARAQGKAWRKVGAILGVGWSGAARVVRNRVYLGEVRVGEWHNPAAHPPIVERGLWEAAQVEYPAPIHRGDGEWLLKGLVRCAGCQRTMTVSEGSYRCLGRTGCQRRARVPHGKLDDVAVGLLFEWAGQAEARGRESTAARKAATAAIERAEAELRSYQRATAALGNESLFAEGLTERMEAIRAAQATLAGIGGGEGLPSADLPGRWEGMNLAQRRHVLCRLLGVVWVWNRDRFRFVARGFEPAVLSRPGRKGPEPFPLADADLPGELGMLGANDVE